MDSHLRQDLNDGRDEGGAADEMESGRGQDAGGTERLPEQFRHLPEKERAQKLKLRGLIAEQEHGLRQKYADWIIWLLGAQFVIADAVFVTFAWVGKRWDLPPGVIEFWLAATVVQVVGVVAIVTRHLFPSREDGAASA
jgi:glutathione S-transferase